MVQNNAYERLPAVKVDILSIKEGDFIEDKGELRPNYVKTRFGYVSRVNIIGIIVSADVNSVSLMIDDGTGSIHINCSFARNQDILHRKKMKEGDCVIVVGRPRRYDDDTYIAAEVINTLENISWLKYRKEEIREQEESGVFFKPSDDIQDVKPDEEEINSDEDDKKDVYEIVQRVIQNNDLGEGVDRQLIENELKNYNIVRAGELLTRLLEQGDLFELRPGKIKLL